MYITSWSVSDACAISSSLFLIVTASVSGGHGAPLFPLKAGR